MTYDTIYVVGLIVALCFLLLSIDDVVWDLICLFKGGRWKKAKKISLENLDAVPPKLLAIIVASWREDSVLDRVIDHMIASLHYPRSMYHVFLGVYPNDVETIAVAQKLEKKYSNVHVVVNALPGPTSKANNLNHIIKHIEQFEVERGWRFISVTVHDSEDVVHPYELKITNYLLDRYDALQFPVFPIQWLPSIRNIWRGMTTGTYADEFAENHYFVMRTRDDMFAVVPSAGTGFVISHRILDEYQGKSIFPEDSLTEDYKLSLILAQQGFHVHYVLEKVPRLLDNGKVRWDYVATRSIFPATFRNAVRQKTRWIFGITMQSANFMEIFKADGVRFAGKYTIYKDLKAKIGNLLVLPGYLVFIYFIISLFIMIPIMYPAFTFSWWLIVLLTIMMVYRQVKRAIAINNVYGFKSVVVACLMPPLIPIRLVWGNIINLCATFCAWRLFLLYALKKRECRNKEMVWNKTDHDFLSQSILNRYYRNIGDELLERQFIDLDNLKTALEQSRREGVRLGDVLLSNHMATEEQLMRAVANVQHQIFLKDISAFPGNISIDKNKLEHFLVYPLMKTEDYWVFAQTNFTPLDAYQHLQISPSKVHVVLTTKDNILKELDQPIQRVTTWQYQLILEQLLENKITWEQAVLALNYQAFTQNILVYMGLYSKSLYQKPADLIDVG